MLYVLAGLYKVQEGILSYNGFPKGNLELESLRTIIGDCLSQEQLFEGTLLENITMGRDAATFDNVKWAVEHLQLGDFVNSLPNSYSTVLDPEGKRLPRSIIQKLLLARSIADKPKLLLLEDAFEHIELQERKGIIDFLTDESNGWTMVAVSCDPYLAERCDTVALMENGTISQTGDYEALKKLGNFKTNGNA